MESVWLFSPSGPIRSQIGWVNGRLMPGNKSRHPLQASAALSSRPSASSKSRSPAKLTCAVVPGLKRAITRRDVYCVKPGTSRKRCPRRTLSKQDSKDRKFAKSSRNGEFRRCRTGRKSIALSRKTEGHRSEEDHVHRSGNDKAIDRERNKRDTLN